MGVVRLAIGFPHAFYVPAAPILFLDMTADIKISAEIPRPRDLTMKGVQFSKIVFFRFAAKLDRRFHTGARCSRRDGDTRSHLRHTCGVGNLPGHRRPLHGKANGRSHDRDRPDERLQPHRHRIRMRSRLLMTCDPYVANRR